MNEENKNTVTTPEEKPPLFKEWNKWYMILIYVLLIQIILYYWLTQSFE
ncbi:MAG: hypothetical protein ACR2GN_11135 [Bacteroidia bacterium]